LPPVERKGKNPDGLRNFRGEGVVHHRVSLSTLLSFHSSTFQRGRSSVLLERTTKPIINREESSNWNDSSSDLVDFDDLFNENLSNYTDSD
jgi:hypothetical protein